MALGKMKVGDTFFEKGLKLCADGYDYDIIRKTLSEDMEVTLQHHELGEKIFRAIADAATAVPWLPMTAPKTGPGTVVWKSPYPRPPPKRLPIIISQSLEDIWRRFMYTRRLAFARVQMEVYPGFCPGLHKLGVGRDSLA